MTLASAGCFALLGCSIDRSGSGTTRASDSSVDADGRDRSVDAVPDQFVAVDAGPVCPAFDPVEESLTSVTADQFNLAANGPIENENGLFLLLRQDGHRYGALLAEGFRAPGLGTGPLEPADLAGRTADGRSFYGPEQWDEVDSSTAPVGVGLENQTRNWAIRLSGELRLSAGSHSFRIVGEDAVYLVVDGATVLSYGEGGNDRTVSATVAADGYVPIEIGWLVEDNDARLTVEVDGDVLQRDRIRAPLLNQIGREVWGFSRNLESNPRGRTIDPTTASTYDLRDTRPLDVGVDDRNNWWLRWVGQYSFPTPGGELEGRADDEFFVFVDGVFIDNRAEVDLRTPSFLYGRRNVVILHREGGGAASVQFNYERQPVPAADMRPFTRFGGDVYAFGSDIDRDVGSTDVEVNLEAPSSGLTAVEASVIIDGERSLDPNDVRVALRSPSGQTRNYTLENATRLVDRGIPTWSHRETIISEDPDNRQANGTWNFALENVSDRDAGVLRVGVVAHYGGVREPFPTTATVESMPIDLGDDAEIRRLLPVSDTPNGTSIRLEARAVRSPDQLPAEPWTEARGDGELTASIQGRFVQLRVRLEGPGTDTPRLEEIRIVGQRCQRCIDMLEGCPPRRSWDGLVALWPFNESGGGRARDVSATGIPLDLYIEDPNLGELQGGMLRLSRDPMSNPNHGTVARSARSSQPLADQLTGTGAFTVETWVTPLNATQGGPARIFTISLPASNWNFTLGQSAVNYEVRLRTSTGGRVFSSNQVEADLQHVVVTWDGTDLSLFVNGESAMSQVVDGSLDVWFPHLQLAMGNNPDHDRNPRPWEGTIHMTAVYDRALTPAEVIAHRELGPESD